MVYQMMIPPFDISNFENLTKSQVKEHFKWYLREIPFRLKQLEEFANTTMDGNLALNKEPLSLIVLWEWFEKFISFEKRLKKKQRKKLKSILIGYMALY